MLRSLQKAPEKDDKKRNEDGIHCEFFHRFSCLVRNFVRRSIAELNRAADAELTHARLERGALDAKKHGCALGAGDAPLRLL